MSVEKTGDFDNSEGGSSFDSHCIAAIFETTRIWSKIHEKIRSTVSNLKVNIMLNSINIVEKLIFLVHNIVVLSQINVFYKKMILF